MSLSPFGLTKFVFVQPSSFALAFIIAEKPATVPPTCSARPFATSFADFRSSPYRQSLTLITSPSVRLSVTAPASRFVVAILENVTLSSRLQFSITSSAVIILVIDAGYSCSSGFFSYSTLPEFASIRIAASA